MSDSRPPAGRGRAAIAMLRFAWEADRKSSLLAFGLFGLEALAMSLFALWLKLMLDGIQAANPAMVVLGGIGIAGAIGGAHALAYAGNRVKATLRDRSKHLVDRRLLGTVGTTPTLEIHENPAHLTQLDALRAEGYGFGQVIPTLMEFTSTAIRIVTVAFILAGVHPLLLLLPLFGLPALLVSSRTSNAFHLGTDRAAEPTRRAEHLLLLSTTGGGAKEIRLFRLGPEIMSRFRSCHREIQRIHHGVQIQAAATGLATRFAFLLGYFGAIVFVVRLAAGGDASIGDVASTAALAGQVLAQVTGSAELVQLGMRRLNTAARFVYLEDVARQARERIRPTSVVPDHLGMGIRLENVSYRYPLGEKYALEDVSLLLPKGSTVAIVGDNGSGKSTLVKLLAGLYLPTAGWITIDGTDTSTIDPEQWRERISAGFQDHARFEFLAREVVGIGELRSIDDAVAVRSAISRAGAVDVLTALPDHLETQLGSSWEKGVELSGGQWQKLALGRAMMRTAPLLLLLDEPTAALDADTEVRLFESWTAAAGDLRQKVGAVTVLVSHRFSTVRMADLIIVLDKGSIVEVGSHNELIEEQGLYAELYELQARAYR